MEQLIKLDNNLWVAESSFKLIGINLGNRMTIVRLSNGELFLHSPLAFQSALNEEINQLGKIRYLIAPNLAHNLFINDWKQANPDALVLAPKCIKKAIPDQRLETLSQTDIPSIWGQDISLVYVWGMPLLQEYVFIHHPSKTLILTDIAFNVHSVDSSWEKLAFKLYGAYGKFSPTWLIKKIIKNRAEFDKSIQEILQHDFDRIIVSHGEVVPANAKTLFELTFVQNL